MTSQIAGLCTTYQILQLDELQVLKRKLEKTTLEMERARMEREDFRQGCGPAGLWGGISVITLRQHAFNLHDIAVDLQQIVAEARNLLDVGNPREARRVLNEELEDVELWDLDWNLDVG